MSRQAREAVRELRQFDLQLAFFRPRPAGEEIENQTGPVDDLCVQRLFKVFCLVGGKVVVEDDNVHTFNKDLLTQLFDFPFSYVGGGIRPGPMLEKAA